MPGSRSYDRSAADLRPVTIEPGFVATADGSALISAGETKVICTASVDDSVPRWMKGRGSGWVTAEYAMLPASTGERKARDVSRGRQDGRSVEIQRLIGRSLRVVCDFEALGERSVYVDCDVLQADGGTRCAAITGGYVALRLAFQGLLDAGEIEAMPLTGSVAAVSVGVLAAVAGVAPCLTTSSMAAANRGRSKARKPVILSSFHCSPILFSESSTVCPSKALP